MVKAGPKYPEQVVAVGTGVCEKCGAAVDGSAKSFPKAKSKTGGDMQATLRIRLTHDESCESGRKGTYVVNGCDCAVRERNRCLDVIEELHAAAAALVKRMWEAEIQRLEDALSLLEKRNVKGDVT